jgi:hypothetical protein
LKQEFYQPLANMGASVYRGIYQAIKPTPVGPLLFLIFFYTEFRKLTFLSHIDRSNPECRCCPLCVLFSH